MLGRAKIFVFLGEFFLVLFPPIPDKCNVCEQAKMMTAAHRVSAWTVGQLISARLYLACFSMQRQSFTLHCGMNFSLI